MHKIFGRKPVLEAINSGAEIDQIIIRFGNHSGQMKAIIVAAKKRGIKLTQLAPQKFDKMAGGKETQGVIAVKTDHAYSSFNEILNSIKDKEFPLLLLLDSIQDTHNLGAILRSAECSGVDGVILTTHNSASINETVEKTSAGAVSHLKICQVNNLNNTIDELKKNGFWIFGSFLGQNSINYLKADFKLKTALILGNEEKGIRKLTAEKCDFLLEIPMKGKIQSLNVSVAAGILLFEVLRQRM